MRAHRPALDSCADGGDSVIGKVAPAEIAKSAMNCGSVRQEVASKIARVLPLPFGVILLWYALAVTLGCKAHSTI